MAEIMRSVLRRLGHWWPDMWHSRPLPIGCWADQVSFRYRRFCSHVPRRWPSSKESWTIVSRVAFGRIRRSLP